MGKGIFFLLLSFLSILSGVSHVFNTKKITEDGLRSPDSDNRRLFLFRPSFYKWHSPEWAYYEIKIGGILLICFGLFFACLAIIKIRASLLH
jgi:hypothetical protein